MSQGLVGVVACPGFVVISVRKIVRQEEDNLFEFNLAAFILIIDKLNDYGVPRLKRDTQVSLGSCLNLAIPRAVARAE